MYRSDAAIGVAIQRWKYSGDEIVGASLVSLLRQRLPEEITCYGLVVPVPLHPARLRRRGFNQAAELARALTPERGRFKASALTRAGGEAAQVTLGRRARAENAARQFMVKSRAKVEGCSVLLVDDIITSGATARACAAALLDSGATCVDVVSLARTPAPSQTRPRG